MSLDSRTFRSICRHFDSQCETPVDIRWSHSEQDERTSPSQPNMTDRFIIISQCDNGEYSVRSAAVMRDRLPVYSPKDHSVASGSCYCYTSRIERARERAGEVLARG